VEYCWVVASLHVVCNISLVEQFEEFVPKLFHDVAQNAVWRLENIDLFVG
jgi:hypothetical protein